MLNNYIVWKEIFWNFITIDQNVSSLAINAVFNLHTSKIQVWKSQWWCREWWIPDFLEPWQWWNTPTIGRIFVFYCNVAIDLCFIHDLFLSKSEKSVLMLFKVVLVTRFCKLLVHSSPCMLLNVCKLLVVICNRGCQIKHLPIYALFMCENGPFDMTRFSIQLMVFVNQYFKRNPIFVLVSRVWWWIERKQCVTSYNKALSL